MRCLVTGVAGFVGSHLAEALCREGHQVLGLDCFTDYYPRSMKEGNLRNLSSINTFRFLEGNLLEVPLAPLLEGVNWIFHQAAQAGVRASWGKSFSTYLDNNIAATQRLLESAKESSVRETLKRIVYASSSSVYGNAETFPTSEQVCPQPVSPYGVSKLAAEHLMSLYRSEFGLPTVSLRYFTVYGPRQRPDMGFHKFIRAGLAGEAIEIYGDGEQSRDFTFIDDAVQANLLAAQAEIRESVFNIGGGSRVTVNEILGTLENVMGRKLERRYGDIQAGDARHTSADTSLAQRELSYSPKVGLEEGLAAELTWLESLSLTH